MSSFFTYFNQRHVNADGGQFEKQRFKLKSYWSPGDGLV